MLILLVAPYGEEHSHTSTVTFTVTYAKVQLVGRGKYVEGLLHQRINATRNLNIGNVSNIRLISIQDSVFATALYEANDDEIGNISALEASIHDNFTEALTVAFGRELSLPWVSRTAICLAGMHPPEDWLDGSGAYTPITVDLHSGLQFTGGWGNSVVSADGKDSPDLESVLEGIIDAQFVWHNLERVGSISRGYLLEYLQNSKRTEKTDSRKSLRLADTMAADLVLHDLFASDLSQKIQGTRRSVSCTLLSVWGYQEYRNSVARRVTDLREIARRAADRRAHNYQVIVELVLLAIGLTGVIQLILAYVQTAYSGGTTQIPGDRDSISILTWLRTSDSDVIILITAAICLLIFTFLAWTRFKKS